MAVYLHIFSLIIDKKAVAKKYNGGVEQFRKDYQIPESEVNQEDDELFAIGQMNGDAFDINRLINDGLSYNTQLKNSEDFTVLYRYGIDKEVYSWKVDWVDHNRVYAWHVKTDPRIISRVDEISSMSMEAIGELADNGENLLKTIKLADLKV